MPWPPAKLSRTRDASPGGRVNWVSKVARSPADGEAWVRFVRLYTPFLYHWARRHGLPPEDTADLVQEVFAQLLKALPRMAKAATAPANAKDALQFSIPFWADQGEELEKRFASWAAQ